MSGHEDYLLRPGQWGYYDTCAGLGEHTGDPLYALTDEGDTVQTWTCCGDQELIRP